MFGDALGLRPLWRRVGGGVAILGARFGRSPRPVRSLQVQPCARHREGCEAVGPVMVGGEFLPPARQVQADFALEMSLFEAVVWGVGGMGGGARIVVKMGFFAHSGGGRVLLDVEDRGAIVTGGGDMFAVKMIAPQVAGGAHGLVDFAGVVRLQVLHDLRNSPFLQGFEDKVHMIGHEAEGMHADTVAAGEAIEMVEVADELGAGPEHGLLAATSLIDVVDLANVEVALAGWGGFVLFLP